MQTFLSDQDFPRLLQRWIELDDTLGRRVSLHENRIKLHGTAMGLDFDGALVIRTDEGHMERVTVGDVFLEKELR